MSKQILHIDSSIFGAKGYSSQLSAELVAKLQHELGDTTLTYHSLAEENVPHFSAQTIADIGEGAADLADRFINEVQAADYLVLSAPMYNFAVPSQLKSWFDYIARAGVTFKYGENGPVGLLKNKKVYVVTTRGGFHRNSNTDSESQWLKTMLGFLGMNDVEFIYAEGLNIEGEKDKGLSAAKQHITAITSKEVA